MKFPGETIVELGTWMGRSASWVAEWIYSHGGTFYCVDLWEMWDRPNNRTPLQDFHWYMWKSNLQDKIQILKSDTIKAAANFDDGSVAVVMFDSLHTEEQLTKEIAAQMPKVKAGGILCGHDYSVRFYPEVVKVVNKYFGQPNRLTDSFWVVEKSKRF